MDSDRISATYTDELGQTQLEGVSSQSLSDNVAVRFSGQATGHGNTATLIAINIGPRYNVPRTWTTT